MKITPLIIVAVVAAGAPFSPACSDSPLPVLQTEKAVHLSLRDRQDVIDDACSTWPGSQGELRRSYRIVEKPGHMRARVFCIENARQETVPVHDVLCYLDPGSRLCLKSFNYRKIQVGSVHVFMYVNDVHPPTDGTSYQRELASDQEGMLALLRLETPAARRIRRSIKGKTCHVDSARDAEWTVRCDQEETLWQKESWQDYVVRKTCNGTTCRFALAASEATRRGSSIER